MAIIGTSNTSSYSPVGEQSLSWQDLYEGKRSILKKHTSSRNNWTGKVTESDAFETATLTPEQEQAIASNNEFKKKQETLLKQGSGLTQSILGGRGY